MQLLYEMKKKARENDKLANVLRYLNVPLAAFKKLQFDYGAHRRAQGASSERYLSLKKYNNIHRGERCFIVATGPSLTIADLDRLKDECTFSMNSIYVSYEKTTWRPDYYVIQDPFVYEKIYSQLQSSDYDAMFVGTFAADRFPLLAGNNVNVFPLDLLWQQFPNMPYHTKFSSNIYSRVYSGYNVAYSALQIAVYMGFSEIYLLGADCDYLQDKKYFAEDKNRGEERYFTKKFYASNTDKFLCAYEVAKQYAEQNNIKIYNATRGGKLEVFPRVDFDTLFH